MELGINNLSKEQLDIVTLNSGKHLVLAPPGTGKTELIAQKVLKALTIDNISEEEIACLTFTNRAARNMINRVQQRIPNSKVFIGNIHSFGIQFLKKNHLIPQASAFIDEEDALDILEEACFSVLGASLNRLSDLLNKFKYYKLHVHNVKLNFNRFNFNLDNLDKKIFIAYEKIKNKSLLFDYDDILFLTLKYLLDTNTKLIYGKFSFLQVDEVQDLNEIQWLILNNIQKSNANVILYGDLQQSIFGFLGAKKEMLEHFSKDYQKHTLTKNFRSNEEIVKMLNTYLNYFFYNKNKEKIFNVNELNLSSKSKNLFLLYDKEKDLNLTPIDKLIEKQKIEKINTAILFYKNHDVEKFYDRHGSKFRNVFKVSKFELLKRKFVKDIFAFLTIIDNPNERLSWARLFHLFSLFKTLKTSRDFINKMFSVGLSPLDFLTNELNFNLILKDFINYVEHARIVFFDTETTGLDTQNDDIVQISAIELIKGKVGKTFNVYIKTNKDVTESSKIHKITKEFLDKNGIDPTDALLQFSNFINGAPLVAHNLKFDKSILLSNINKYNLTGKFVVPNQMFDSIDILKRIFPELKSYKLERIIELFNLKVHNSHNALDDVNALKSVILSVKDDIIDTIKKSENFINHNKRKLEKFHSKFAQYYNSIISNTNPVSFNEIITDFVNFAEIIDPKFDEIEKLLNHMDLTTKPDKINTLLSKHLMFYKKCKTADLITDSDEIFISTIHKAKGLEFDTVIIPECDDYNFPYFSDLEKVKLLYVAMSRAKNRLIITAQNKAVTYVNDQKIIIPYSLLLLPINKMFNRKLDW